MLNLLSNTRTTRTLPVSGADFSPAYWVAGINDVTGSHILKTAVYNSSSGDIPISVAFEGVSAGAVANLTVLTAPEAYSFNEIGSDVVVTTSTSVVASAEGVFVFELPELSVSVLEVMGNGSQLDGGKRKREIPRGYREIEF